MRDTTARNALLVSALLAVPPGAASAQGQPYTPARECAVCHETIHQYWSESAHARSARPAFLESLRATAAGPAARRDCIWCHAPTVLATGDWAVEQAITGEGVTCDFCHTVASVHLGAPDHPFELAPGDVKLGPLQYTADAPHGTAYSTLHRTSALLCASCHEYRNEAGIAVLSTWSEWRDSPYAERGETCQECHMPLVPGRTVVEGLESSQRVINLHRMSGGSVSSKLASGLELKIDSFHARGSSATVGVVVTNAGVGHAVPGGLSSKSLVLAVGVDTGSGGLSHRLEQIYRRELLDAGGRSLTAAGDLFLKAASVGEDTRIGPKQSRAARFTLPLPEGWRAVVARLEYRDASDPSAEPTTTLIREERRER